MGTNIIDLNQSLKAMGETHKRVEPHLQLDDYHVFSASDSDDHVHPDLDQDNPNDNTAKFVGFSIGVTSLFCEHFLAHPFTVLRRQCQVHPCSTWYHLQPFTLFPVITNISANQGLFVLWKGLGSVFIVRGVVMLTETILGEVLPLARNVTFSSSMKKHFQHLALKGLSILVTVPFYTASLMETVQSSMVSDRSNVFDCFAEGLYRIRASVGQLSTARSRLIGLQWLVLPVTVYGTSHYVISCLIQAIVLRLMQERQAETERRIRLYKRRLRASGGLQSLEQSELMPGPSTTGLSPLQKHFPELIAAFLGSLTAEVLLYPLETITHRLMLQGTRSIIDNMDTGNSVLAVTTHYDGFWDCGWTILRQEGLFGLYKGFGALVLQYSVHAALLRFTYFGLEQVSEGGRLRHWMQRMQAAF